MSRFVMWRLRTPGERMRLIVAGGAAVLAALTLVLLIVDPQRTGAGDARPRGATAALPSAVPASPTPRVGSRATAGRPSHTATPTRSTSAPPRTTPPAPTATATGRAPTTRASAAFAVTVEAESAQLGGSALRLSCGCSGGAAIGQLGSGFIDGFLWRSGWLTFGGISAPAAGDYTLTVTYRASRDRDLRVSVNGGETKTVRCRSGSPGTVTTTVRLAKGANSVKLFNDYSRAPDLDKIKLSEKT
ncbi:hypothetical protein [Luedemannella helvata]|uniref:CBM6 domain-containing protein n=1 Tax=Luedemannella helvata TaxID=349315 RepID=A0ABN2L2H1_9ACTN